MKFLANTHDPEDVERAKKNLVLTFEEMNDPNGKEHAWQRHLEYLSDKIISDPQETAHYTVDELKAMGLVGVYTRE